MIEIVFGYPSNKFASAHSDSNCFPIGSDTFERQETSYCRHHHLTNTFRLNSTHIGCFAQLFPSNQEQPYVVYSPSLASFATKKPFNFQINTTLALCNRES